MGRQIKVYKLKQILGFYVKTPVEEFIAVNNCGQFLTPFCNICFDLLFAMFIQTSIFLDLKFFTLNVWPMQDVGLYPGRLIREYIRY